VVDLGGITYNVVGGASGDDFVKLAQKHGREVANIMKGILERSEEGLNRPFKVPPFAPPTVVHGRRWRSPPWLV